MKKRNLFELMSKLMLFVLAVVSGGAAMAVEVMSPGTDGKDPNAGTPIENAIEANPSGVEVPGGVASGSAVEEIDQAINEVEDYVAKFKSHKYPMHHDFLKEARQVKVDTKEPVDFEIGEGILDFVTKGDTEGNLEGDAAPVELNLYSSDKKPCIKDSFKECFVLSKSLLSLSGKSRDEIQSWQKFRDSFISDCSYLVYNLNSSKDSIRRTFQIVCLNNCHRFDKNRPCKIKRKNFVRSNSHR